MMSWAYVILLMVFLHIVDDYYLQAIGSLASMKQRKWWEEHFPQKLYKYDYLVALLMHSMSWAFMVMLPISVYWSWDIDGAFVLMFIANTVIHAFVDHMKANWLSINLIIDQSLHMVQILSTFLILILPKIGDVSV